MIDSDSGHAETSQPWVTVEVPATSAGRLALMGFPGLLIGADSASYIDPAWLNESFCQLKHQGCELFFSFVHQDDLPDHALRLAENAAQQAEIEFLWLPIPDFGTPSTDIADSWRKQHSTVMARLHQGQLVGLSCLSGIGRSGMMAADLLVHSGMSTREAIDWVRKALPEAIENPQQESWVGS